MQEHADGGRRRWHGRGQWGEGHRKPMQPVFTMLSQPPPRQYSPPLDARTVCQENKRVSRGREGEREGERVGRLVQKKTQTEKKE